MRIDRRGLASCLTVTLALMTTACTVKLNGKTYGSGSTPSASHAAPAPGPSTSAPAAPATARTPATSNAGDEVPAARSHTDSPLPAQGTGANPTLANTDNDGYDYEVECDGSLERASIPPREVGVSFSQGCTIRIVGVEQRLTASMTCEIRDGALTCE